MTDAADLLNMSNRQLWLVCDVLDAARAYERVIRLNLPQTGSREIAAIIDAVRALDGGDQ